MREVAIIPGRWWLAVSAVFVGLAGCGSREATVSGKVTLGDKPLTTGTVAFHPVAGGPVTYGTIDSRGHYQLSGRIAPGEYVVTVVATEDPVTPSNPNQAPPAPKLITPVRYGDRTSTDLHFTVNPGPNPIDLPLTLP